MRWWCSVWMLAMFACDGGAAPRSSDPAVDAGLTVDATTGDQRPSLDQGPPDCTPPVPDAAPPVPALSACDQACDRAADCATDSCEGFAWTNAGRVDESCHEACGGPFVEALQGAAGCPAVMEILGAAFPALPEQCAHNPCFSACARLGACIAEGCPAVDAAAGDQIASDCAQSCNPQDAAWVEQAASCQVIVDALAQNDPNFERSCQGEQPGCADAPQCAAYGEKVTGCLVEHCEPGAADFAEGLRGVLADYCHTDPNCPAASAVAAVLGEEVTCEHPWLRDVGAGEPFTAICQATTPPIDALRRVCEAAAPCPGLEGLADLPQCAVLLALRPEVAGLVACLNAAEGACPAIYDCLGPP